MFEKLVTIHETDTYFFVHASVEPTVPLDNQGDHLPYWGGYSQTFPRHVSGKIMVCGHKIQSTGRPPFTWRKCLYLEWYPPPPK